MLSHSITNNFCQLNYKKVKLKMGKILIVIVKKSKKHNNNNNSYIPTLKSLGLGQIHNSPSYIYMGEVFRAGTGSNGLN